MLPIEQMQEKRQAKLDLLKEMGTLLEQEEAYAATLNTYLNT